MKKWFFLFGITFCVNLSYGQKKYLNQKLVSDIYTNVCYFDFEKRIKNNLEQLSYVDVEQMNSLILDTTHFYFFDFKERTDIKIPKSSWMVIEFTNSINDVVVNKNLLSMIRSKKRLEKKGYTSIHDSLLWGYGPRDMGIPEVSKGLVAVDTLMYGRTHFISGYFFKDDIKPLFFNNNIDSLTSKTVLEYITIVYYNLEPYDIVFNKKKKSVEFKTKVTPTKQEQLNKIFFYVKKNKLYERLEKI